MIDALLYLAGIAVVILGIALSIGLHELGHYLPAKRFGVYVKQFMIGFGPTVKSWNKGETEFGIKAFPLGGYILMKGMYPPEKKPYRGPFATWINEARKAEREDVEPGEQSRQFHQLKPWKKMVIMLGGPTMNFFLGMALILVSLSGIGTMQTSLKFQEVYQCIEPQADGSCTQGAPLSPAALAGLQPGDQVVAANGQSVTSWNEVIALLNQNPGSSSTLEVSRGGELLMVLITPVFSERPVYDSSGLVQKDASGDPVTELRPILGVRLAPEIVPLPLDQSLGYGLSATGATFGFILTLPQQVWHTALSTFGFEERNPNGAVSIIGVGQIAGEVTSSDLPIAAQFASLLMLIGSLNLALFAFNLIPLLPLDGGHVLGALYESLKRKTVRLLTKKDPGAIDTARALPLAYGVWVVLIAVGLVIMLADLVNPITLG